MHLWSLAGIAFICAAWLDAANKSRHVDREIDRKIYFCSVTFKLCWLNFVSKYTADADGKRKECPTFGCREQVAARRQGNE
ncbi:hypothetical protein [Legionella wadsworthii]|uniref:hypothetical protein n=1 Tax=Legionella wadsworthii TaxID=28088 RepID=UPI000E1C320C|nr:hypothetical protein [Legionella wadsworthii]